MGLQVRHHLASLGSILAAPLFESVIDAPSPTAVRRETGKAERVKVPNNEEIVNHIVPESCAAYREVRREALTGRASEVSRRRALVGAGALQIGNCTNFCLARPD